MKYYLAILAALLISAGGASATKAADSAPPPADSGQTTVSTGQNSSGPCDEKDVTGEHPAPPTGVIDPAAPPLPGAPGPGGSTATPAAGTAPTTGTAPPVTGTIPPASGTTGSAPSTTAPAPSRGRFSLPKPGRVIRSLFDAFAGAKPTIPSTPNMLTLQNAMMLSQLAKGSELTQSAFQKGVSLKRAEEKDRALLENKYRNLSNQELATRLQRAETELSRLGNALDSGKIENLDPAEQARYRNAFVNAAEKAKLADQALKNSNGNGSPTGGLARSPELSELFSKSKANDQDSLVDRLIMLNGMLEKDRQALLSQLALAETIRVVLPSGETKQIPLLHNGYLNTVGRSEMDCPTFVAATLSPKFRKMNLTTLDLHGIWAIRRTGALPKGIQWAKGRDELLQKVAQGFEAVDLYLGEKPEPGDILVQRIPWQANGRVVIVKSYDPDRKIAMVAEPAQDSSRLVEFEFPLRDKDNDDRMRPGLADLRLIPEDNSACRYPADISSKPVRGPKEARR